MFRHLPFDARLSPGTVAQRNCVLLIAMALVHTLAACRSDDRRPAAGAGAAMWPADARDALLAMAASDQEVRAGFGPETASDTAVIGRMIRTDSANTRRLLSLIDSLGWPGQGVVDSAALEAAFLLVQHTTDTEFQERMLPLVEADVKAGRLDAQDYALLVDRTREKRGLLQLFGTQVSIVPGSRRATLDSVEDSGEVDARRAAIGLPPLARYLEIIEWETGFDVVGFEPATSRAGADTTTPR
jgi:Family of unknown function (DUF6624)